MPVVADHIIDLPDAFYKQNGVSREHNSDNFNPLMVKENDLIFVKTDFIVNGEFTRLFLNKIYNRFNLITGVSSYHLGRDGGDEYLKILNHPGLNKWFCTNPPLSNSDKIVPLPIGFEERERPGGNQELLQNIHSASTPFENKKNKILLPYHTPSTNPQRTSQLSYLRQLPFVDVQETKLAFEDYLKLLDEYKFIIGLEGSGPDIHRNYESLLVGSIPINSSPVIQKLFEYYEIYGIFLDDWYSLKAEMFETFLNTSYNFKNVHSFLKIDTHVEHIRGII